jgi:hypothetical protein
MSKQPTETSDPTPPTAQDGEDVSADKLFRTAAEMFLGNLVELVRPELAATLDFDQAKIAPPKAYTDFRKQGLREPDVVAEVPTLTGKQQLLVVHVDIEDKFGKIMDQRMLEYGLHLILKTKKPVISIAIFLKGGKTSIELREVVWEDEEQRWVTLRFYYVAFCLKPSLAEDYVNRPQPLASALAALMRSNIWDRVEQKLECLRGISRAEALDMSQRYVLGKIVDNYLDLSDDEEGRFAAELKRGANKEVSEMVVTWEEALEEREATGEARGEATGEARGEVTGEARGLAAGAVREARKAILLLAERRQRLPPEELAALAAKLEAIHDLDRLHRILEAIVEVSSLAELDLD